MKTNSHLSFFSGMTESQKKDFAKYVKENHNGVEKKSTNPFKLTDDEKAQIKMMKENNTAYAAYVDAREKYLKNNIK